MKGTGFSPFDMNNFSSENKNPFSGNPAYYYMQADAEKRGIKTIGITAGFCIIGYFAVQYGISELLSLFNLYSLYRSDSTFQACMNIIYSVFGVLLPFFIGGLYLKNKTGTEFLTLSKPNDKKMAVFGVGLAFFVCLSANYFTSWLVTAAEQFGVSLYAPEYSAPSDLFGRIIYVISVAVIPALCEEVATRGAIMQPLRKYGDRFAIIASSVVFALLHGNLVQAPFALIAGIGMGYVVCFTESLWTGIAVHMLNNLYSVIVEFMMNDIKDEALLNKSYTLLLTWLYLVSGGLLLLFALFKNHRKLEKKVTALSGVSKGLAFAFSIPMLIAFLIILYVTASYVNIDKSILNGFGL